MELLQQLLENSQFPIWSAFLLGLMTAVSPCPLATNITAVGYLSKDIESRRRVFINGLLYTLGRAITYTGIGLIFYVGIGEWNVSGMLQQWGEKLLGPLMILIGLFMIGAFNFVRIPGISSLTDKMGDRAGKGYLGALLLGLVFALAFCPYSGVLYFGMLIPMTVSSASGLYLPLVFALATGIPVILFSWLIAYSVGSIGGVYHKMHRFETWFRRIVAVLFLLVGVYYSWIMYL
ncbi:MAG: aromatic aminobenezylarsenical efflux permease ArsG family transporter [Bacteroidales bacterium]|jgi:cytochrome c biogenesis protein CcdA|nr:aromatic aminobenezylarsenical efflux permease ArsG family transporter [Bacteroidales bacterium]MDD3167701.1 aromatic aminobenezylarsenical efflux permease ArsG family transporter [Bacteroidales bacterium]MDD4769997.1 aromatic aminobenezylarsenical efflux permease ArsG family transporter [Bacteroidales bacterium]HKL93100.1 aromatic aminobenezylarsenical efflux permease ArsG family transporter [Bacteroidales bacterium]